MGLNIFPVELKESANGPFRVLCPIEAFLKLAGPWHCRMRGSQWRPHAAIWTTVDQARIEVTDFLKSSVGQWLPSLAVHRKEC